jgi:hypothetical protein
MSSDLTDGAASADPGVDQLFRILTAGPTRAELAGERDALAMFRANVSPLASPAAGHGAPATANGTPARPSGPSANGTMPIPVGRPATEQRRNARRRFQWPARWSVRLAAAGVVAIVGGTAAAAYAAALPAPVQNLAHQVLGIVGVPAAHHQHHAGTSRTPGHHGGGPAGLPSTSPGRRSGPGHSAKVSPSAHAHASPSASPRSTATGPAVLSASASSADIMAGATPVIDGQLTRSGTGIKGVTVKLIERLAGHVVWHVAGTAQTGPGGNVAITGQPLAANAVFRLWIKGGVHSAPVPITVTPQVTVVLTEASALRDLLTVTTQFAHRGNVVWLQVQSAGGSWVNVRSKRLNAAGKTWFILGRKRFADDTVQVVLVATVRHGSATSNSATVQPPG